jgi:hypothetical protein
MKYLKKFYESKEPIDVDSDIEEFNNIFKNKINYYHIIEYLNLNIKKLSDDHGSTMTDDYRYYKVYETDDYGRETRELIIVRAVNEFHARLKAAIKRKNIEIVTTGYFGAIQVDIESEISNLEKVITTSQSKLEELKRIS